jgi:hypothetical protein
VPTRDYSVRAPATAAGTGVGELGGFLRSGSTVRQAGAIVQVDADTHDPIKVGGYPFTIERHDSMGVLIATAATRLGPYRRALKWQVPAGYRYYPAHFESFAATAGSATIFGVMRRYGSYNLGTNTWTDAGVAATPYRPFTKIQYEVMTALSSTAATTVFSTVTRHDGAGSIATPGAQIALSAAATNVYTDWLEASTVFPFTILGTDITTVGEVGGTATTGVVDVFAANDLAYHRNAAATREQSDVNPGDYWFDPGEYLFVDIGAAATTAQERYFSIDGILQPIPA